jgi:hypothetical protein
VTTSTIIVTKIGIDRLGGRSFVDDVGRRGLVDSAFSLSYDLGVR